MSVSTRSRRLQALIFNFKERDMAFGLQFLDGVGNAADSNVFPYDYENKEITPQQMDDVNEDFRSFSDTCEGKTLIPEEYVVVTETTTQCRSEVWMNRLAWLAAGMVAGQLIKKIFKD
jgi:hypothetical protein